jgi:hypothetical protein
MAHPKNPKCALCKRWGGSANLVFKNKTTGFEFYTSVYGKCMANNCNVVSTHGAGCRHYEPSYEASRML